MPIFRMPVVLHVNYPHANCPHADSLHANYPSTVKLQLEVVDVFVNPLPCSSHNDGPEFQNFPDKCYSAFYIYAMLPSIKFQCCCGFFTKNLETSTYTLSFNGFWTYSCFRKLRHLQHSANLRLKQIA